MPRQKLRAGQLGTIQTLVLPSGRIQARALLCDDLGVQHRLKASAVTEADAVGDLHTKADALRHATGGAQLTRDSTIAEACEVFLRDKEESGLVEDSTVEAYEASVRNVVIPACGDLLLIDLSVRRCNRILTDIRTDLSLSSARKARSVLSQTCAIAIEHEVLMHNPVRDTRRLPLPEKKESVLTPGQLLIVQDLIRGWRTGPGHSGPRPNVAILEDAMWIMVGTSVRIGEVLALRRTEVDVTTKTPMARFDGTIRYTKKQGLHRKNAPKRTRQKRRIALPSFSAAAMRRRLAVTDSEPEAYLFATRTGKPLSVSNYERLLRTFVDDNQAALQAAGIDVDDFSTHIFRRSTATIVEAKAGIGLASRLLGHADEQVTRRSYVVTEELVDPVTADIMDDAFVDLL
ncbi:tyrosine-type recombinase/integrase [Aeromicrobium piscarium]|uniref:Phage integrase family protein n=1 Tax=Aeromicrobium piscarium TaxID=2590901 RepID=A0A554S7W4_9ACTN|nr:tyrosine-type recombinase/integrase [Aeromicrobium piscarium]TSD62416.1 phage integrase family protein [Aeromicrobium piscarium]